jgi:hypothetical protein
MGPMDQYTDQEADRLSQIMVNDPHFAANELRGQLQQLDPQTASVLIAKTKNDEYVGGLGDLQIQVEFDQSGQDSGFRNVTMTTQNGIEQIAELQAQPPAYGQPGYNPNYNPNPLGFVAGVIVGDLLWQQQRGLDFNDGRNQGWCNREQGREQYWNQNSGQILQNWGDANYRQQYQNQNWQTGAFHPTQNNTYITNNRIDNTTINKPVNITNINETINNTRTTTVNNNNVYRQTLAAHPQPAEITHPVIANPGTAATGRQPYSGGGQQRHDQRLPVANPAQTARPTVQERPLPGAQAPYHAPAVVAPAAERQHGPTAAQQAEIARQAAANTARENAANTARENAANTARENAANTARENAANTARENAARQQHPPAAAERPQFVPQKQVAPPAAHETAPPPVERKKPGEK